MVSTRRDSLVSPPLSGLPFDVPFPIDVDAMGICAFGPVDGSRRLDSGLGEDQPFIPPARENPRCPS